MEFEEEKKDSLEKKHKKLRPEVEEIINNQVRSEAKTVVEEEAENVKKQFFSTVAEYMIKTNEKIKKYEMKNKLNLVENILKSYIPLKHEINNIEKSFMTEDELKNSEDEFFKKIMESQFAEINLDIEEKYKRYIEIRQTLKFIDNTIESYINQLKKINESYSKSMEEKPNRTLQEKHGKNLRKIYLLEHYYKEGILGNQIKQEFYQNERRFNYDKVELLSELAPYFSGMYNLLDIY